MSKLRSMSICLSDIPKDKMTKSEKNGKFYISLTTWDNDEPDKFGNDFGISISQTKEERETKEKKIYVGNGKIINIASNSTNNGTGKLESDNVDDDLPF